MPGAGSASIASFKRLRRVQSADAVGSVLSVGSIGSARSVLSIGSAASAASMLSFASRGSLLSARAVDSALGGPLGGRQRRATGLGLLVLGLVFLRRA